MLLLVCCAICCKFELEHEEEVASHMVGSELASSFGARFRWSSACFARDDACAETSLVVSMFYAIGEHARCIQRV